MEKIAFCQSEKTKPGSIQEFEQRFVNENRLSKSQLIKLPINMFTLIIASNKDNELHNKILILLLDYFLANQKKLGPKDIEFLLQGVNL